MLLIAETQTISVSALVSAIVSGLISLAVNSFMNRGHNERMIYGQVQKIIEFAITYPYLEDDSFCYKWPTLEKADRDEDWQRYECYCCHVFNTIERVYELCKHELESMKSYLYAEELIIRHRGWWNFDQENKNGYTSEFQAFVDGTLRNYAQPEKKGEV